MASFDPSVISQIPGMAGDPMGSVAKALTLKDLVNTNQLNQLRLKEEQKQFSDAQAIREILKKEDLSNPEGILKAAQSLTSKGYAEQGMSLIGTAQKYQSGAAEIAKNKADAELARIKDYKEKMDTVASVFDDVRAPLDAAKASGRVTPDQLDAMTRAVIVPRLKQLAQDMPEIEPQVKQFLSSPSHLTYAGLVRAEQETNRGQQVFENEIKKRHESTYEKSVEANVEDKAARRKQLQAGLIPDEDLSFMAKQYLTGDKSVFQNLGRGAQGSQNIQRLRSAVRQEAEAQRLKPEEVAGRVAAFNATVAEERKIGNIAGGVEFASSELNKFIPLALKSSEAVPRGSFVPFNKLLQSGQAAISDPNLKRLYVNTQGVLNAYDVLAARGGTDMAKREATRSLLMTADSPQAYAAALDAMKQELEVAKEAGAEAKERVASELGGGGGGPKKITSDADYNALPSGSEFIAPDGSHRRKP